MTTGQYIRKSAIFAAAPFSLQALRRLSKQYLLLPFYHAVSDERLPHLAHILKIRNLRTFKDDIEFFLKHFHPVDAAELVRMVNEQIPVTRPVFHLTFDDGLKEMITTVAPVLQKYGIPATFFINTGFIGNHEMFYRYKASLLIGRVSRVPPATLEKVTRILDVKGIGRGCPVKRMLMIDYLTRDVLDQLAGILEVDFKSYREEHDIYMNESDIRSLLNQGFTVGAHSIDHPEFKSVGQEEQIRQTNESMQYMTEKFGVAPVLFSFPFSDDEVNSGYFEKTHKPQGCIDLSFGTAGMKTDTVRGHLQRIPMETGAHRAEQIIKGEYLYFLMKAIVHKNRINRI